MNPVVFSSVKAPELIPSPRAAQPEQPGQPEAGSFGELLGEAIGRVREVQGEADKELRKLLAGEPVELHRVMMAGEQAGLASSLMMSVRNKVVDAYQEIMRMQV